MRRRELSFSETEDRFKNYTQSECVEWNSNVDFINKFLTLR